MAVDLDKYPPGHLFYCNKVTLGEGQQKTRILDVVAQPVEETT
jgi:hypothetical protein